MSLSNILFIPGIGGRRLLLDDYPGAAAAYSLRKLRGNYTGPCVRVRRSSDSTEQDIGFSGGFINTSAMLAFCGAGDGFVTTWYDQATNKNATQGTTTLQPRIVTGGSLVTYGGKPAINNFARNANIGLVYPIPSRNLPWEQFTVFGANASEPTGTGMSAIGVNNWWTLAIDSSLSSTFQSGVDFSSLEIRRNGANQTLPMTRIQAHTNFHTNAIVHVGISGVCSGVANWDLNKLLLAYNIGIVSSAACFYYEHVIFTSNQASKRTEIDANQIKYWGVV